jgi:hypothetical protein
MAAVPGDEAAADDVVLGAEVGLELERIGGLRLIQQRLAGPVPFMIVLIARQGREQLH